MAPVAAALGARLAGGFFTGSIARAGAPSYPPVSSATGQYVTLPGSEAEMLFASGSAMIAGAASPTMGIVSADDDKAGYEPL